LTLCLNPDEGQPKRLRLKPSNVNVGGVEHVALLIVGDDGDEARYLIILCGHVHGESGVFSA
jgi:hypothetical protein